MVIIGEGWEVGEVLSCLVMVGCEVLVCDW